MPDTEFPLSFAAVSAGALRDNYAAARRLVPPGCLVMAMLKADAYGHGAVWAAKTLESAGADFFGVATAEEALTLREAGVATPLLVMGYSEPARIPDLVRLDIAQTVCDLESAREYAAAAGPEAPLRVHIKLDTGMARYGIDARNPRAAASQVLAVCALPELHVEGLFTHFSDADAQNDDFTPLQARRFALVHENITDSGQKIKYLHCANTAAVLKYPHLHYDMVRLGIGLYGLPPAPDMPLPPGFRPVMTLSTTVVQLRTLPAGDCASYGRLFTAPCDCRLAVVRLGYGDGLPRAASRGGVMYLRGRAVPIVGTVCMDACLLDVSEVPDVGRGEQVTVFGEDAFGIFSPQSLADACSTISYELVTRLSPRIFRLPRP